MRRILLLLVCLCALLTACNIASARKSLPASPDSTTAGTANIAAVLPSLAVLHNASYTATDLTRQGSDFLSDHALSQLASIPTSTTQLLLSPDFTKGDIEHQEFAYAIYGFNLEDYVSGADLSLDVVSAQNYNSLWLALSNWTDETWEFYNLTSGPELSFTLTQFTRFIESESNECFIAVISTGTQPWKINELSIAEPTQPTYVNENTQLGTNLEGIRDWSRTYCFTDVFMFSRWWISQPTDNSVWDDGRTIDTDEYGWVSSLQTNQQAAAIVLTSQGGNRDPGQYVLLYDGEGTIAARLDFTIVSNDPGRVVLDCSSTTDGLGLIMIAQTNPSNYIRNIRVIPIKYETTFVSQLFHPDYLTSLDPFNVLRFMDLMNTNNNPVTTWSERTTPLHNSQARDEGVCVEYLVALANEAQADPWFCMPHAADDNYIRQFATYVRDNLNPQLRVYVEYSNEVWNGIFDQADYARSEGLSRGLSTDGWEAQLHFHSMRSVEVMSIWDEVFADEPARIVRVMGGWAAVPSVNESILDYENAYQHVDALAIAPYFGYELGSPDNANSTAIMPISEILQACAADSISNHIGDEGIDANTELNRAICNTRGLLLLAYEGGQHLVGHGGAENNETLTAKLHATNRDTGMRQVIYDDLVNWHTAGGELFMFFTHTSAYSKWGSWGVLEYQNQDRTTAPKWQALNDYIAAYQD